MPVLRSTCGSGHSSSSRLATAAASDAAAAPSVAGRPGAELEAALGGAAPCDVTMHYSWADLATVTHRWAGMLPRQLQCWRWRSQEQLIGLAGKEQVSAHGPI